MKSLSCKTMREGMIVSAVFLLAGSTLLFLAVKILPNVFHIPLIAIVLSIGLVLLSPIILILTFITTILPGSKEKLEECDH